MSAELPSALDAIAAQASEQAAAVRQAVQRVGELRVSAGSADGLVLVEVGAHGQLQRMRLDPEVYKRVPPAELAEVITGLVRIAAADAAERAREIMGPVLPGGLPAGRDWWDWTPSGAGSAGASGGQVWLPLRGL